MNVQTISLQTMPFIRVLKTLEYKEIKGNATPLKLFLYKYEVINIKFH